MRWSTNHPGITLTNPQLRLETYTSTVEGEVENPVKLNRNDLMKLPKTVSVNDFHCVEGWSVLDCKGEGVKIKDIEKIVNPKDVARAVTFDCADNYTTSLFREELAGDFMVLVYKLNDEALDEGWFFLFALLCQANTPIKVRCGWWVCFLRGHGAWFLGGSRV